MRDNNQKSTYKVLPLGVVSRVAIFMTLFVFIPMTVTGVMIEKKMLVAGENIYLAIPLFFFPLIIPFSRYISHFLINKDLQVIEQFCAEIKQGNYSCHFDLPNQSENEDNLLSLQRNLTWMAHSLSTHQSNTQYRFGRLQHNFSKMQKQAFTDPLTSLYNRRYLNSFVVNCKGTEPYSMLSMIYIDCDKFKQVNDTMGHATGDKILTWLAKCLKQTGRQEKDIPLRLGGDEFAMLVMDVTSQEVVKIGQRIQDLYHKSDVYQTTLSIGIASIQCNEVASIEAVEELTKEADRQAYFAKKSGGNCLCIDGAVIGKDSEKTTQLTQQQLAYVDPLTNIPNRYLAKERFTEAVKRAQRKTTKLCLIFLDLDDFKSINDSMSHIVGDKYLQHIVKCIRGAMRADDSVCRFGGDEFLILFENINSKEDIPGIVSKIFESISKPLLIDGKSVSTTPSMGITLVPDDGIDFDDLCKRADIALNSAKNEGKNKFCFFDPKMAESLNESLSIINDLRVAVQKNQLELYLQPQIDLEKEKVIGAETLIRWNHPTRGLIFPGDFIELAEKSNLIIDIGYWILDEACRMCSDLLKSGMEEMVIAVNVSPIQLKHKSFSDSVLNAIRKYDLQGKNIELEFTESILLKNNDTLVNDLTRLRKHGVKLAIDDFGTGYSNLGYLKTFDITKIKIDRSFVSEIAKNKNNMAIVDAIIRMSQSLSIDTVAEGVEDLQTIEVLKKLGGKTGQGYYWQKPIPVTHFMKAYCSK